MLETLEGLPMARPMIGQIVFVRGIRCEIVRIRPAGTIDVVSTCGRYAFRVSGLYFGE